MELIAQGVVLAVIGSAIGLGGAFVLAGALKSLLFGIGTADPVSYLGAALVMTASVLIASALPAWRAARIDPTLALRQDASRCGIRLEPGFRPEIVVASGFSGTRKRRI
jgi:ABC-type antimicrobial peptide transport system permease subunit